MDTGPAEPTLETGITGLGTLSLHEHQHQPLRIVLGVAQRIVDRRAQLGAHMDDALLRVLADFHNP